MLYDFHFSGVGFYKRRHTTVFRANIQKRGRCYAKKICATLEEALDWLVVTIPQKRDEETDPTRKKALELFLEDAKLQKRLYERKRLTKKEIQAAMEKWRQDDFSLAGRIRKDQHSSVGRSNVKKGKRKRRRTHERDENLNKVYSRKQKSPTQESAFPYKDEFDEDDFQLDNSCSNDEVSSSDDIEVKLEPVHSYDLRDLQTQFSRATFLNPLEVKLENEGSPTLGSSQPSGASPFEIRSPPLGQLSSAMTAFKPYDAPTVVGYRKRSFSGEDVKSTFNNNASFEQESFTTGIFSYIAFIPFVPKLADLLGSLGYYSNSIPALDYGYIKDLFFIAQHLIFHILSFNADGIVECLMKLLKSTLNHLQQTGDFSHGKDFKFQLTQLYNAVSTLESKPENVNVKKFQLDNPEMYSTLEKGYVTAINSLARQQQQSSKVLLLQTNDTLCHMAEANEELMGQFIAGDMRECGLTGPNDGEAQLYFNFRRISRPQIAQHDSGCGPNFLKKLGRTFYEYSPEANEWIVFHSDEIVKKACHMSNATIVAEMTKLHNPFADSKDLQNEIRRSLLQDAGYYEILNE